MKTTFFPKQICVLLAMTGSIFLLSCDKKEAPLVAATFTSTVSDAQQAPRLVNTFWSTGDAIGISGVSAGVAYTNVKYVTPGGNGQFTVAQAGNEIYYQSDEQVTFTAYYPFTGTTGTAVGVVTKTLTANDQLAAAQPSIDYLYGKGTGSAASPQVTLGFDHCMSRVVLNFAPGDGFANLPEQLTCTLGGLVMQGSFNPADGKAHAVENAQAENVTMEVARNAAGSQSLTLIFFPQATPSATLDITAGGVTYVSTLQFKKGNGNPDVGLHPGYSYIFNVTVCKTGLVIGEANVSDWIPGNGTGGEDVSAEQGG